ncbi:MAG: type I-U CRISPR-associated protein Csx17 [Chthoniobacterales bacterium]
MSAPAIDVALAGCAPVPLAHYLKALGVLRLVSEQRDASAQGFWKNDTFHLTSPLDRNALLDFFLKDYHPTPIIAPWNGGSGFFSGDNKKAINAIAHGNAVRFANFRPAIGVAIECLNQLALSRKPEKEEKHLLLQLCRNRLRGTALDAFDTAVVLTADSAKFPPLVGTGWNDGRLEFTNNFMQRLLEVIDPNNGAATVESATWLAQALFWENVRAPASRAPVGQFLPGSAGGANAIAGFEAKSSVNPWDFVLMMEGTLLFSVAAARKLESAEPGKLLYPFCVRQAGVGYASASLADENDARSEMWMPLWSVPATLAEIRAVFSEGRAEVGGRPASNGVDFARAVVTLGVDRGIAAFQRYGFQVRNGLAYFATPLERVRVERNVRADLLLDIDAWLDRLRGRAGPSSNASASVTRALRGIEEAILDLCKNNRSEKLQAVLIALGACEHALTRSERWAHENTQPVFGLTPRWLREADTGSVEFRLAATLASTSGVFGNDFLPLRAHLEPVEIAGGAVKRWARWLDNPSNDVVWREGSLVDSLNTIFLRRLVLAQQIGAEKNLADRSVFPVHFSDLAAFIDGETDDDLIGELLWGLALIDWQAVKPEDLPAALSEPEIAPSAFYALLKLCFAPPLPDERSIPLTAAIHRRASRGDGASASELTARRLRASGFAPAVEKIPVTGTLAQRTAAALLFPIRRRQVDLLRETVLRPELSKMLELERAL